MASVEIELPDLPATEAIARAIAPHLRAGDFVGLAGPLGVGKTTLARALVRARLGREEEVPSPSYTLVQTYALPGGGELWHADLYRLGDPAELCELGLDEAFAQAIVLVEWPERLADLRPARGLALALGFVTGREEARRLRITPEGGGWGWIDAALRAPAAW